VARFSRRRLRGYVRFRCYTRHPRHRDQFPARSRKLGFSSSICKLRPFLGRPAISRTAHLISFRCRR